MKLVTKTRTGSRVRRTYGPAQTPFQRVLASGVLDVSNQRRQKAVYRALEPVRLLHQLETLQEAEALWRHALFRSRIGPPNTAPLAVPFDLGASGLGSDGSEAAVGLHLGTRQRRKYRRSEKSTAPR